MTDELIRAHVRALLNARLADSAAAEAQVPKIEARGYRIVQSGPLSGTFRAGPRAWQFTDWRTGEILISGTGDGMQMLAAGAKADPDGRWFNVDNVRDEIQEVEVVSPDVPASLDCALDEWIRSSDTPDADIAAFVGWPVQKVAAARDENLVGRH